jgi:hypothetical protein
MATTGSTIRKTTADSTKAVGIQWRALTTALGHHINLTGIDASKMILLVAHDSTTPTQSYIFVGTSDSAATGSSYARPFSAAKLYRTKISSSKTLKATAYTKLRATNSTKLMKIVMLGPFETAKYKDSNGYIKYCKGKTGSTTCYVCPILLT